MAVYTKINKTEIQIVENKFDIGKVLSFSGIKKGIENTNYIIKTKSKKYILTIFDKRFTFLYEINVWTFKIKDKMPRASEIN